MKISPIEKNVLGTSNDAPVSVADFVIPDEIIDFPRESEIPAGNYFSEIDDVSAGYTKSGKKCVDVYYYLQSFKDHEVYYMKLRYPEGSRPLNDLYRAVHKAGVPVGSDLSAAIGVTEKIKLVYDSDDCIGRIAVRVYDPVPASTSNEEDE